MATRDYQQLCLNSNSQSVVAGKGRNIIPPPERESLWRAYLKKFGDPIIIVLLVVFCLSVSLSLYEVIVLDASMSMMFEPLGVLLALLLATGVGFIFEVKAGREFEILNRVKDSRPVKVLRRDDDGNVVMMLIEKQDVVVGDIVRLESGDEIPADGELLEAVKMCVDESNFTGEPYANKYVDEAEFDDDATYKSNFMLRGATIIEGSGVMVVTAVGMDTEEGHGVARASEGSDVETPLNMQLDNLGKWISTASFVIAALIIVGRLLLFAFSGGFTSEDVSWVETLEFIFASVMIAVTLIVVAVPEGLPMSITVSLAMSMRRMLKENSLVRKLHACETMGAATVICTDKTGTLTCNRMTVVECEMQSEAMHDDMVRCMAINSTAELTEEDGKLSSIGNPTEGALLMWLRDRGENYGALRDGCRVVEQVPFSTEIKYMSTTVEYTSGRRVCYIKGAPEVVLDMCGTITGGKSRAEFEALLATYQSKAMRTLGFAYRNVADDGTLDEGVFMGIVGIADPIREDVPPAIKTCMNSAGVRVIIVTGDTPGTAMEIGRQIGLVVSDDEGQIITGPAFAALSDEEARELLRGDRLKIISRARPDDKARLVMLLQANGEVVAVTGDGTNDAPALSKAQVGLSMGDGTSRAKEASDITIIDNSFASINKAIMWGRSLYLNIRRFIIFQMTINLCACMIVLFGAFLGFESPLTVTQMLWVNLIMDTFAAMALSSLPADRRVLEDKPRAVDSHIIDGAMIRRILCTGILFFVVLAALWQVLRCVDIVALSDIFSSDAMTLFAQRVTTMDITAGELTPYEMGLFFSVFVMMQFWNLFNARYFRTKRSLMEDIIALFRDRARVRESYSAYFPIIALVILFGQVLIVNYASQLFSVAPLSLNDWLLILAITAPVLIIPDIVRLVVKR